MTYPQSLHLIPISMLLMGVMSGVSVAQANSLASTATDDNSTFSVPAIHGKNEDPADGFTGRGSPNRRVSGGSRGSCSELLVALVPGDEALAVSEAGCSLPSSSEPALTTVAMPVLWFHVPVQTDPVKGELALLDNNQLALSIQEITLPQAGGIIGVQVETELDVGLTYNWVFSLLANPRKPADNPRVAGTLQRINPAPEVVTEINATESPQKQAEIWFNQGVWHNALTTVATLRQSAAGQVGVENEWQKFLGSAGLEAVANAPIQDCCR
ncbi:MAG: DUF928 domain-containing protein [Leptolyngbya sp. SIO3F4]|nr:DUF928 domain-containing protein [Leptolyngbya sp. SIO3F4]